MANTYYSPLSSLITWDHIPEELNFISNELDNLLDNVFFTDLYTNISSTGSTLYAEINIISFTQFLSLNMLGTGVMLTLNPSLQPELDGSDDFTNIPISLIYRWDLLNFLSNFQLDSLSSEAEALYNLILNFTQSSDKEFTDQTLANFELNYDDDEDSGEDDPDFIPEPVEDQDNIPYLEYNPDPLCDYVTPTDLYSLDLFVTKANSNYPDLDITQPLSQDPEVALDEVISGFNEAQLDIYQAFFDIYMSDFADNSAIQNINKLFYLFFKNDTVSVTKDFIIPRISASLFVSAGLEVPRAYLLPVDANNVVIPGDINTKLVLDVGELFFDSKGDFGFSEAVSLSFSPNTPKAQIANTGLTISFTSAMLDLSQTTNIPEATAAGYANDFVGLFVQQATIAFSNFGTDAPTHISASIIATNFLIGTGGVSGSIAIQDQGILYRNFGTFAVELDKFSLTFRQNSITNCAISGTITLDRYTTNGQPSKIAITALIKDSGDFSITATPSANFPPISLPGVFDLHIRTLTVGEQQPKGFYVEVSGTLDFAANIPVLGDVLPKGISITKLRLWDDGTIDFRGGSLSLPVSFKLNVGPVNLEVHKMSLGSYNREHEGISRNYCFFGFDGMVNLGSAGIEASGNGIKFYFTIDDGPGKPFDCFVRIDTIGIDITIPANSKPDQADFILKGSLSVGTPNPNVPSSTLGTEYSGSVSVSIPRLHITGSAGMRLNPDVPSFLVDLNLELSSPIPLGGTSLAIYGFRGLIGEHYIPSKSAVTPPLPDTAGWSIIRPRTYQMGWKELKKTNLPISPDFHLAQEFVSLLSLIPVLYFLLSYFCY